MSRNIVGVDVGGTFTDLLMVDEEARRFTVAKVPTTPEDQSVGFLDGIAALAVPAKNLDGIIHGTTIGTNAVLERKGAACGLITTRGFRDTLELGRRTRPYPYGMIGSFEAIIPRELRQETTERIDADGEVVTPLDEADLSRAIGALIDAGAEALVIHFIHGYLNPVARGARRWRSPGRCGPTTTSRSARGPCARCASSSAAARRRSTATSSR